MGEASARDRHAPLDALLDLLRPLLPEAWRDDLTATVYAEGFSLRCRESDGREHVFDVQRAGTTAEGDPSYRAGAALRFSYTLPEAGPEAAARVAVYERVIAELAAREADLAAAFESVAAARAAQEAAHAASVATPDLSPPPPEPVPNEPAPNTPQTDAAAPLPNERPAPEALAALLTAALPEAWRHDVRATLTPDGFALRFRDDDGRAHLLDARHASPEAPALVTGRALALGATLVDAAVDDRALADAYRPVLEAIAAREDEILPWITASEAVDEPRATGTFESFLDERPAPEGLTARITNALPAHWRNALSVARVPQGFVLRFTDDAGHRHILEARTGEHPALVRGRALGFSYRAVEQGADEVSLVATYRAAMTALLAVEDELAPWIDDGPAPLPVTRATGTFEPFADESPAPDALVSLVSSALPEAWRNGLSVARFAGGLVVRATDASNARHIVEARTGEGDALVRGSSLGFSYRALDGGDETARADDYRAVLSALVAREADLAPWITDPAQRDEPHATGTFDALPDERPAPPALTHALTDALPAHWRHGVSASLIPDGFVLRFADEGGHRHILEARTGEGDALVRGSSLGFSYRTLDGDGDAVAVVASYRALLASLIEREAALTAWITPPAAPADEPRATGTFESFLDERPAPEELTARITNALPAHWRNALSVARVPQGFVLRFTDDAGHRHILEARTGEHPALVRGRALGFSYRAVEQGADEVSLVATYRAAMTALLAVEDELAPWIDDGPAPLPVTRATGTFEPFADESPAPDALVSLVSSALPEAWRNGLSVARFAGGLVVRATDASNARHIVEARTGEGDALVRGSSLGFSYRALDGGDETARADDYRAVLSALVAREADLAPWITDPAQRDEPHATGTFDALPDERPAPPALTHALTDALPAHWRHGVSASLIPDGFVLRFADEGGHRHILEARTGEGDALVRGSSLGFSYRTLDGDGDAVAVVASYRALLASLIEREAALTAWITPPAAPADEPRATGTFDVLPDESPAPEGLSATVIGALPAAWRAGATVARVPQGFVLRAVDEAGRRHILEARGDDPVALVRARRLGFSYRAVDGGDEVSAVASYRATMTALVALEDALLPWITDLPAAPPASALAPTPDEEPAPEGLHALASAALPASWRRGATTTRAPWGFVLRATDEHGGRHLFEARLGDAPALVRGRSLGFSTRADRDDRDDRAAHDASLAVMHALLEREDALLAWVVDPSRTHVATESVEARLTAREQLVALLPEAWRGEVAVHRHDGGAHIRAVSREGTVRTFELHRPEGSDPARFSFADAPRDAAERAAREALDAHASRFIDLLTTASRGDLWNDADDAPAGLTEKLSELLPAEVRAGLRVQAIPHGFCALLTDAQGTRHALEGRRVEAGLPALVRGARLGFSYLKVDPALDEVSAVRWYRTVFQSLVAHEGALADALDGR